MPEAPPSHTAASLPLEEAFAANPEGIAVLSGGDDLRTASIVYTNPAFQAAWRNAEPPVHLREHLGEVRIARGRAFEGVLALGGEGEAPFFAAPLCARDGSAAYQLLWLAGSAPKQKPQGARGGDGGDFAEMLAHSSAGVIAHRHFRPLYANPTAARMLGFEAPQDLLQEACLLRFAPIESYPFLLARQARLLESGEAGDPRLLRCVTARGARTWIEARDSLMHWGETPIACLTLNEAGDLAEARQSEALLREAVDNLSDSFILYDDEDRVVLTNRSWHEVFPKLPGQQEIQGAAMRELVRQNVVNDDITDPTLRADNAEEWIDGFIAGRHANAVTLYEDRWPSGRWDLVREQRLESGGFVSVRTDITDRKRVEEVLRDQEARLEHALAERTRHLEVVLSNIAQGVVVLDPDLRVVLTNNGLHEIVGYPRELGRPGTHVSELIRDRLGHELYLPGEDTGLDAETLVERRLAAYRTLTREVYQHPFPNGRVIEIHREKLRDGSIICTFTDVTDRVEAEEELKRQREALHQSEKLSALGMLLAGVAHELNNPLQVVLGQATLLESALAGDGEVERAGRIRRAAERCARIVKVFLAMARDEPASRVPVDVNEAVERALDLASYQLQRQGVELHRDLSQGLPPVSGDPDQLNQVFVNLLINAMQAMERMEMQSRIEVRTYALGANGEVGIDIRDHGPGVPEHLRGRIFDPFFTTKPVGVGTGVGLSVCHGMVTAHGGTISVEDAPGGGALFRVRLPQAEVAQASAATGAVGSAAGRAAEVLVVDDEAEIRELLSEFLAAGDLRVTAVASAQEALERLGAQSYDAVICDLRLPGMDGPALFEAAGALDPALQDRFIFATGDLLSEGSQRFLDEAARPYLEKPFLPDQVRRIVGQVVGK